MSDIQTFVEDLGKPPVYKICIEGHLDQRWTDWFDGLSFVHKGDGTTALIGRLPDQAALHGVLSSLRDLGLPIVSVRRLGPESEGGGKSETMSPPGDRSGSHLKKPALKNSGNSTAGSVAEWSLLIGLILLSLIPIAGGAARIAELTGGAEITPDNARFFASPVPVVLHILSASCYSILGAFQFLPGFRSRMPRWHRLAGQLLIPFGLMAGLSGLWMTQFYPHPAGDGDLLYIFRLLFGSVMVLSIGLGFAAIRRGDLFRHGAWMTRGYAIGLGAGTQALVIMPWVVLIGQPGELSRALLMGAGWVINLAIAEWVIRRCRNRPSRFSSAAVSQSL